MALVTTVAIILATFGGQAAAEPAVADPAPDRVTQLEPVLVPAGSTPESVDVGDINGDDILDIAESNDHSPSVAFLFGLGDRQFTRPYRWNLGYQSDPGDLVLADFNMDGQLDVAVCVLSSLTPENAVTVRLVAGGGRFGDPVSFPVPARPSDLTDADVNADGRPDLLVVSPASDVVSVLIGDGPGGFTVGDFVRVGSLPSGLDVGDFDADGNLDFAVTNRGSASVSVLAGDGTGAFPRRRDYPTREQPKDVDAVDMNSDGYLDLVVGSDDSPAPERSTVAFLNGRRGFAEAGSYQTLDRILTVTAVNWDEDGVPDIAVTSGTDGGILDHARGHLTIAAGGFGPEVDGYISYVGNRPTDLVEADMDGDGHLDLVTARSAHYVAIVFNPLGSP